MDRAARAAQRPGVRVVGQCLHTLAGQVPQGAILIVAERLACVLKQFGDGVLAGARHAADRADRHVFDHHAEDLSACFAGEFDRVGMVD